MSVLPTPLISTSPDRLGGTPVFSGTRVPVQSLIDYLEAGHPLDHFLDEFPSVTREHAIAVLELAKQALLTPAA
ncbi:DUF433 domain-containing protein [Gemmatimonas sp. UBA7669]|uniref:DUF433 domain-containing protein n=1 Tax=Gemmatimonas sp. UBA7669 TaxID=1946568 RepID=UPI0025C1BA48|nr:DUF433 domain-containing protein [Gemmatimonas sp. UBA7669]